MPTCLSSLWETDKVDPTTVTHALRQGCQLGATSGSKILEDKVANPIADTTNNFLE